MAVRSISESITYDPLKKQIGVRCHFMGANVATALLAVYVAKGKMTIEEAMQEYGTYVMSTVGKEANVNYDRLL